MFKIWKLRSQITNGCFYANIGVIAFLAFNLTIEGFRSKAPWKWPGKLAIITLVLEFLLDVGCCAAMKWLGEPKIHFTLIHNLLIVFTLITLLLQEQSAWVQVGIMSASSSGIAVYKSPYVGCVLAIYAIAFAVMALIRSSYNKKTLLTLAVVALLIANASMHPSLFGLVNWPGVRYWDLETPIHVLIIGMCLPLFLLRS
eukprot:CAMPEP_0204904158 /NCGR_PEP_ID=MMETSP1397-20131031/4702_1 /ASSEMBLY_ACC=CAM_ASM_000891 /TAXON_ID=49980 /ORGANISM="Climacostomum Climacostomum virens, Strain Stock W-24" /LENGTH=199 /DNA_ID=CAMNT_0052072907 /DNA_START=1 /DNA_END=600 /DNA_ORIENTATION=-